MFYFLHVLFPALVVDILIVSNSLWKRKSRRRNQSRRNAQWFAAFAPAPLYLVDAFLWIYIYGQRFQGQGAIGLIVFLGYGIAVFFLRLRLGLFFVKI